MNDTSEQNARRISINQLRYGILMGEARKAIQFTIEDGDEELIQFIREFNEKREQVQSESIKRQEITNRGALINHNQVLDPLRHQSKGRPPVKRLKSSTEYKKSKDSKNKDASDGGRKCGLCEATGHYRSTCSKN